MKQNNIWYYFSLLTFIFALLVTGIWIKQIKASDIFKEIVYASVAGGIFSVFATGLPHFINRVKNRRRFRENVSYYRQSFMNVEKGETRNLYERILINIRDTFSYNEMGYLRQKELDLLADLEFCRNKIPENEKNQPYAVEQVKQEIDKIFLKYLGKN